MICQRNGQIRTQFVRKLSGRNICQLSRKLKHLGVDLVDERQILWIDAVKGTRNNVKIDLVRHFAKADTTTQRDKLAPRTIFADGSVVVNALDSPHGITVPANTRRVDHPHGAFILPALLITVQKSQGFDRGLRACSHWRRGPHRSGKWGARDRGCARWCGLPCCGYARAA